MDTSMLDDRIADNGPGCLSPRHRLAMLVACSLCGCTTPRDYIMNGFKVGPNYQPPPAPAAQDWIDSSDQRVRTESDDLSKWWKVFNDPVLDDLICDAYRQNLTLREAGFRILQARAQLGITIGNLLPQTQNMSRRLQPQDDHRATTANNFLQFNLPGVTRYYSQWDFGFNLAWELDFWGKFRRALESDSASLDASDRQFRRRPGHHARRHRHELRADAHRRTADQVHRGKRQVAEASSWTSRRRASSRARSSASWTTSSSAASWPRPRP